ncbi:MAG: hypothetical protein ABWX96_02635 [Propionibacteriaceae bacterium]
MSTGLPAARGAGFRRTARHWHLVLLGYLLVFLIVPFRPNYPDSGLDPSWQQGINAAVAAHLAFGRDVVFTFGPYAAVSTGVYHPDLPWLGVVGGLVLALGYVVAMVVLLRGRRRWVSLLLGAAILAGFCYGDTLDLLYPLVAVLAVHRIVTSDPGGTGRQRLQLVVLAAPLGLLPLVKLSAAPAVLAGLVAASLVLALRRRLLDAVLVWVSPAVTAVVLWLVAGQPLLAMDDYVLNSLPIVTGYTEAMSLEGNAIQVGLVLVASLLIVVTLLLGSSLSLPDRLVVTMVVAATLLVTIKAGLVRHDNHALLVVAPLIVGALAAAALCPRRGVRIPVVVVCLLIAVTIRWANTYETDPGLRESATRVVVSGPVALAQRIVDPARLDEKYAEGLARVRKEDDVPRVPRGTTVDIYPNEVAGLLAQGADWDPRPVFQSYAAYTPALARLNADHLLGPSAPERILFRVRPIDERLPVLEDGASWLPLLERYRITGYDAVHDYLVMKRRPQRLPVAVSAATTHVSGRLGQALSLPTTDQGWLASFDVRPSVRGRLSGIVWKTPPVRITVTLEDGRTQHFRFVPQMAGTRLLLSPLVLTTSNFAGLVFANGSFAGAATPPRVTAIRLDVEGSDSDMWSRDYSVALTPVRLPAPTSR